MRALVLLVLVAGVAHAQPAKERARAVYEEAQRLYTAGKHAAAAEKFDEAYKLDADPGYLYNSAQAYRKAEKCAIAATRYRWFLDTALPPKQLLEEAKANLAQAEACAQRQAAERPEPREDERRDDEQRDDERRDDEQRDDERRDDTGAVVVDPVPPRPEGGGRRGRRIAGLAIAGVGAVALGLGVYYTLDVRSLESDREAVCPDGCTWTPEKDQQAKELEEQGERSEKIAIGAYVAGALAVAGGVALYVMSREPADRDVAVAPTPGGALVVGRFRF